MHAFVEIVVGVVLLAAVFGFLVVCAVLIRLIFVIAPIALMPTKEMVRRSRLHEAGRVPSSAASFTEDDEYGARHHHG